MRRRVLVVLGTRPEVIKMVPVLRALGDYAADVQVTVCATSQHSGMLQQMFAGFGLAPDYELEPLYDQGLSLNEMLARLLIGLERVYNIERPDLVLVHGDTLSAVGGALAAFYAGIPVGHVEAGYRTSTPLRPFPEETNRRLIGRLAALHFAPTPAAYAALRAEGIPVSAVSCPGNTVVDVMRSVLAAPCPPQAQEVLDWADGRAFIVLTVHRRENWDKMDQVVDIVCDLAARWPVVWAAHPNPLIVDHANHWARRHEVTRQLLVRPAMDYGAFVHVLDQADVVVTDSGGVVEEAATLGIPMAILRDETERPEVVQAGLGGLTGVQRHVVEKVVEWGMRLNRAPLTAYGHGTAGIEIAATVYGYLKTLKGEA